jgi:hypothetical protein
MRVRNKVAALYHYVRLRRPKHWGWVPSDETALLEGVRRIGLEWDDMSINVHDYRDYFNRAEYSTRYPKYSPSNIAEKSLEHFIAQHFLELSPSDVYIDIANGGSPVPEIYRRLYGCVTYAQDLTYEAGIHGNKIGSDAGSLPLPDGTVNKMALHCSLEHFEGDSDSQFVMEASRVLRVGGKFVVVPLYTSSVCSVATDVLVSGHDLVKFEDDAVVAYAKEWGNRHGRFYDPDHLLSRLLSKSKTLVFKLVRIVNAKEVSESAYARFVLIGTRINSQPNKAAAGDSP